MTDDQLVRVLKALGDPNRFRMVREIAEAGELNCGQITEKFDLSQPTVSHHLKILTDAGVLRVRGEGQHRYASIDAALLSEVGLHLSRPRPPAIGATKKARTARRKPSTH